MVEVLVTTDEDVVLATVQPITAGPGGDFGKPEAPGDKKEGDEPDANDGDTGDTGDDGGDAPGRGGDKNDHGPTDQPTSPGADFD